MIAKYLALGLLSTTLLATVTTEISSASPIEIEASPQASVERNKGFFDSLVERFVPTGIYFKVGEKDFFFGEYSDIGSDLIKYKGSLWEVRINGRVSAHGYGETPRWVIDAAKEYFGWD